jgi:hypothetical protein
MATDTIFSDSDREAIKVKKGADGYLYSAYGAFSPETDPNADPNLPDGSNQSLLIHIESPSYCYYWKKLSK